MPLPDNDFRYLRVTVHHGPDDPERIEIADAWVRGEARPRRREVALAVRATRAEDEKRGETVVTLDLGSRHQPFAAVVLDVAEPRFFRSLVLESRIEPAQAYRVGEGARRAGPPLPLQWTGVSEGSVYRYQGSGQLHESVRIDASGRARVLRLRVANHDDPPLHLRGITVLAPVERIGFEAAAGRGYRLAYGSPRLSAPRYDLARTVVDRDAWLAASQEARLLPSPSRSAPADTRPWTERQPGLLWAGLIAVVALLGGVTFRALKAA